MKISEHRGGEHKRMNPSFTLLIALLLSSLGALQLLPS